jgi:hypothetical protein
MRFTVSASLWALVAAGVALPARAATVAPTAGIYAAQGVYTAVAAQGGATGCPVVGSTLGFHFSYPGAGKLGATFLEPVAPFSSFTISKGTFPKTPAAGTLTWSGTVSESNSTNTTITKATFTATLQYFDASSFLGTFVWTEPQSSGSCVETIELTFIKTGHL